MWAGSVLEVDEAASVGAEDDAEVNTTVDVPAGHGHQSDITELTFVELSALGSCSG